MRNTRHFAVNCFFYDRSGIQSRLEALAEKGWMLDSIDYFGWRFKRIEPKKLRYAVTYFAKAGEYTPGTDSSLAEFNELCAHSGWNYVASASNLRVYCNENADPVPIDTDPAVELDSIHRAAKKSFLIAHYIYLGFSVLMLILLIWQLFNDPVSALSDNKLLFCWCIFPAAVIMSLVELIGYFRWRKKALITAGETGEFLPSRSHPVFMRVMTGLIILLFLVYLALDGLSRDSFELLARVLIMLIIGFVGFRVREHYKESGYSAKANFGATFGIILVLAVVGTVLLSVLPDVLPEDSSARYGSGYDFDSPLPLSLEDLCGDEIDSDYYRSQSNFRSSIALAKVWYYQEPQSGSSSVNPKLFYTVTDVHIPIFYNLVLGSYLSRYEQYEGFPASETRYVEIDPTPWGMNRVFEAYTNDNPREKYILCDGNRIIYFEEDRELPFTDELKAIFGEKLGVS